MLCRHKRLRLMSPNIAFKYSRPQTILVDHCAIFECITKTSAFAILLSFLFSLGLSKAIAAPPRHRVDLANAYTWVDVGDWQMFTGSYTYQAPAMTSGLATRVLRRESLPNAPTDLSLLVPFFTTFNAFSFELLGEWSPQPTFVPQYALQLSPALRFSSISSALHLTYRYAKYTVASAQVVTPGFSWLAPKLGWGAGIFLYITIPEFGKSLYTPQLRVEHFFNYFWRTEYWLTYGYETLNDRFVDPARQAPQVSIYGQLKHLFNDYSGINLGLSWIKFLPKNDQMAEERFNRDRVELSIRTFFRF